MGRRFQALARLLENGVRVPGTRRRIKILLESMPGEVGPSSTPRAGETEDAAIDSVNRVDDKTQRLAELAHGILRRHIDSVIARCPQLGPFRHAAIDLSFADATAFLAFVNDVSVLYWPEAQQVHVRRQLVRLSRKISDPQFLAHISRQIAIADLADGVVERAGVLVGDWQHGARLTEDLVAFDRHYGALPSFLTEARDLLDLNGDIRGRSLQWFFANNIAFLCGKRVLHVAPEETLEIWMRRQSQTFGMNYETLDGFSTSADHACDLTELPFADASYDLVICHRVMEHIVDDRAAYREISRILCDDGVLSLSVPQSPHLATTKEWLVQDTSHHDHVRQYGRDLDQRLEAAGFEVKVDSSLLNRSLEEHASSGTYPLRHFVCRLRRKDRIAQTGTQN